MGRLTYVCAICSEHFTRKYSANRHNHNLHNGAAEIVRLIDYLAGRSSGQYIPNNPFWFKRNNPYNNIASTTIPDIVGDKFQPRYIPQQASLGTSQYSSRPIHRSSADDQNYGTILSQGTVGRIKELKGLMKKYPQQHIPDGIIRLAIFNSINGDNTLVDQMLEQLHGIGLAS